MLEWLFMSLITCVIWLCSMKQSTPLFVIMCVRTHMAEAAPHHLELINQLLVQRTHFRMHQLLMHSKANSKDVNLWRNNRSSLYGELKSQKFSPFLSPSCFPLAL